MSLKTWFLYFKEFRKWKFVGYCKEACEHYKQTRLCKKGIRCLPFFRRLLCPAACYEVRSEK